MIWEVRLGEIRNFTIKPQAPIGNHCVVDLRADRCYQAGCGVRQFYAAAEALSFAIPNQSFIFTKHFKRSATLSSLTRRLYSSRGSLSAMRMEARKQTCLKDQFLNLRGSITELETFRTALGQQGKSEFACFPIIVCMILTKLAKYIYTKKFNFAGELSFWSWLTRWEAPALSLRRSWVTNSFQLSTRTPGLYLQAQYERFLLDWVDTFFAIPEQFVHPRFDNSTAV